MAIELAGETITCTRCGTHYPKRRGNYYTVYGALYRGTGSPQVCKNCVDAIYNTYLGECLNTKDAVRQVCRKLDLYWNEDLFNEVAAKTVPKATMDSYIIRLNNKKYNGKCYDDSLREEEMLWQFGKPEPVVIEVPVEPDPVEPVVEVVEEEQPAEEDIDPKLIDFWGDGFDLSTYESLQKKYEEWSGGSQFDIATEMLVKQICLTELDIARDRADGRSPEKDIAILNSLLGSANLKPVQKQKADEASALADIPLGVWLHRYEDERPLPEVDEELKDVNHIREYVFTWMGHLCKMLGLKNAYSELYENAIEEYSVQKPEYNEEEYDDVLSQPVDEVEQDE